MSFRGALAANASRGAVYDICASSRCWLSDVEKLLLGFTRVAGTGLRLPGVHGASTYGTNIGQSSMMLSAQRLRVHFAAADMRLQQVPAIITVNYVFALTQSELISGWNARTFNGFRRSMETTSGFYFQDFIWRWCDQPPAPPIQANNAVEFLPHACHTASDLYRWCCGDSFT